MFTNEHLTVTTQNTSHLTTEEIPFGTMISRNFLPEIEMFSVMRYAVWELNKVAMRYNANGGKIGEGSTYYLDKNGTI